MAAATRKSADGGFRALQPLIREELDVHQVVLAWRAWDLLRLVGPEHALTMLRVPLRQAIGGVSELCGNRDVPGTEAKRAEAVGDMATSLLGHGSRTQGRGSAVMAFSHYDET